MWRDAKARGSPNRARASATDQGFEHQQFNAHDRIDRSSTRDLKLSRCHGAVASSSSRKITQHLTPRTLVMARVLNGWEETNERVPSVPGGNGRGTVTLTTPKRRHQDGTPQTSCGEPPMSAMLGKVQQAPPEGLWHGGEKVPFLRA